VRPILEDVRRRGDRALLEYARKFRRIRAAHGFAFSEEDLAAARRRAEPGIPARGADRCRQHTRISRGGRCPARGCANRAGVRVGAG